MIEDIDGDDYTCPFLLHGPWRGRRSLLHFLNPCIQGRLTDACLEFEVRLFMCVQALVIPVQVPFPCCPLSEPLLTPDFDDFDSLAELSKFKKLHRMSPLKLTWIMEVMTNYTWDRVRTVAFYQFLNRGSNFL
jgi:hypothetical protein